MTPEKRQADTAMFLHHIMADNEILVRQVNYYF